MSVFNQDYTLPALPIPELEDTCQNLQKLVNPLVNKETAAELSEALEDFLQEQGPKIQELLIQWAKNNTANTSWLRSFWDDSYLTFRERLPINMNYTFKFTDEYWGEKGLPSLIAGLTHIIGQMRTENLPAEPAREGFLSMDTLAYTIYTRIPENIRDIWYHPPLSDHLTASVVCGGHWFILPLMDQTGEYLSPTAIEAALTTIRRQAETMTACPPVSALTCTKRKNAAELRQLLLQSIGNRLNLESIEKSIFTICLDKPLEAHENFNLRLVTGDAGNRWFDKSLQIIHDGRHLGVNIEHSGCDAGIWVYLLSQTDTLIKEGALSKIEIPAPSPRALEWDIPEPIAQGFQQAAADYQESAAQLTFANRKISNITKEKIKAMKCSPDAFVQLLYQVAYYKATGRFRSVYEAVSTRNFYQGRTECVRPVTEDSAAFVRAFVNVEEKEIQKEKFYAAVQAHSEQIKRAQKALGSERHITGLSIIAQMHHLEAPKFLDCEGYKALCQNTVSTSSSTAPYIDFFSFGPVAANGIGIGYGIKPDGLHASVSAYTDSNIDLHKFLKDIGETADAIYQLDVND